jgi:hypothetical protein
MKKVLLAVFICFYLHSNSQCLIIEVPLQKRTAHSDLIIEGKVTGKNSFWNEDRSMIYTSNTIEIYKVFKGNIESGVIEIITPGGIVKDKMIRIEPSLSLAENETGIFMLENVKRSKLLPAAGSSLKRYEPYSSMQGFIKYDMNLAAASDAFNSYSDIKTLYRMISPVNYKQVKPLNFPEPVRNQKMMAITGFSPSTITAGTNSILTINGSGFGASRGTGQVLFSNGDDGGATMISPLPTQYISWTDTEIQVEVPTDAGTGNFQVVQGVTFTSASAITIPYSHLNVQYDPGSGTRAYQTDHIDMNTLGGYTWQMNTNFDANTSAKNSFMRAFDTWRCGTQVNWTIGATTAVNVAAGDNINIICFDNDDVLPAGVLGTCASYWSGCTDGVQFDWFVTELDIIFDEGSNMAPLTWEYGTAAPSGMEYDFETVAVHELGHGHQLGHVIDPGAIMHYAISNGSSNRSLSANDLAGGNYVQAKSEVANLCADAMIAYSGCSVLPISVTSIKATSLGNQIKVEWNNASESGVDHYELEESGNGISFTLAAKVPPFANNGFPASYNWIDRNVFNGTNYYRVKSFGHNGEIKYTDVVKLNIVNNKTDFIIYPNPVKGNQFTLELNNLEEGNYTLQMYNSTGQLVMSKNIVHSGGSATELVNLPAVSKGWYAFRLNGGNEKIEQRLMVE